MTRAVLLGMALVGCKGASDPVEALQSRTTPLCQGIVGMEAVAWEYYNGVPVVDEVLPPDLPSGGVYTHTDFPLLGFFYPAGWTPFEIRDEHLVGVDLVRDDQQAVWRYVSVTVNGSLSGADARDFELGLARDFFGLQGQPTTVCSNEGTAEMSPGSGIIGEFSNVLVRHDTHSILVGASVTTVPGLPQSFVYLRLMSAPTGEFPDRLLDSFIAIDWQLLVSGERGNDRDGDGWLDEFDAFPDDPDRH